jgi:hypothetical protein
MAKHALLILAGLVFGIALVEWIRPESTAGVVAVLALSVLVIDAAASTWITSRIFGRPPAIRR